MNLKFPNPFETPNNYPLHPSPENHGFFCIPFNVKAAMDSAIGGPPESGVEGEPSESTGVSKRGFLLFQGRAICFSF
jgi:hypothetical protein